MLRRVREPHAIGVEVLATPWGVHCTRVEHVAHSGERPGTPRAYAHS
ncbi:hypothetical protein AB0F17_51615 [Nonomuraea sp. NPDC026600]